MMLFAARWRNESAPRVQSRKLSGMMEMRKPTDASNTASAAPTPVAKLRSSSGRTERAPAPFRSRLFAVLLLFAIIPTVALALIWAITASQILPLMTAAQAWERVARSGERAIGLVRSAPLDSEQLHAVDAHEAELRQSVELATRFGYIAPRAVVLVTSGAFVIVVLVAIGGSRVAGHLSRQLSRPLDELVGWTALLRSGRTLPESGNQRGAPEFEVLRSGMRTMAAELEQGRQRALEAERADAFRESARRFAHELKNPLTPIRFAVDRLRRSAPAELRDTVEVLAEEASRLETMARSFAQFGRLPDGAAADVDMSELVAKVTHATIPDSVAVTLDLADALPLVTGYHEALVRAVTNVLVNAVEALGPDAQIFVSVSRDEVRGQPAVCIAIRDNGTGISPAALERIFDPYVTTKPGGTGLGLAIARQTVTAHDGLVEAESSVGVGTEIRFRIPVNGVRVATSATHAVTFTNGD
jgi:two-component system nitrogen regulation sensor histidine kinase NtrY